MTQRGGLNDLLQWCKTTKLPSFFTLGVVRWLMVIKDQEEPSIIVSFAIVTKGHLLSLLFGECCRICNLDIFEPPHGNALLRYFHSHCKGSKLVQKKKLVRCKLSSLSNFTNYKTHQLVLIWFRHWRRCYLHVKFLPHF